MIPRCDWCGEQPQFPDSRYCLRCRSQLEPDAEAPKVLGALAVWRRQGEGHPWLVYGRHDVLAEALAEGEPVKVRTYSGRIDDVTLDHVTGPNADQYAWGHPSGRVKTDEFVTTALPAAVGPRAQRAKVRRHTPSRNSRRRDAMR